MYLQIDPNEHYLSSVENVTDAMEIQARIMEELGLIPGFVEFAEAKGGSFTEAVREAYGFPTSHTPNSTLEGRGVYLYPEDPPLHPIAHVIARTGSVLVYPYGLVAILEGRLEESAGEHPHDKIYFTRMD